MTSSMPFDLTTRKGTNIHNKPQTYVHNIRAMSAPVQLPHTYIEQVFTPPASEDCVEFRLLYAGHLPPDGDASTKHAIRKHFHPQLKKLWKLNSSLYDLAVRYGALHVERENESQDVMAERGMKTLAADWNRFGYNFLPLVQPDYCLACSLDILFLRNGSPGRLVTNGDLDARIKTIFDALQMPQQKSECGGLSPASDEDPFFTLLENDRLISEVKVTTDELLDYAGNHLPNRHAHLVISVKLTPTRHKVTNWVFQ